MSERSQPKKRRLSAGCFLILLLFCVGLAGGVWALSQIPELAEQQFGRASNRLNPVDRILYSTRLLLARERLLTPVDSQGQPQRFRVEAGEPANSIFYRLEMAGLIPSADDFRTYMVYAGLDTGIQAGDYELSPAWNSVEIGRKLQDATPSEVIFVILAGWRAEEIAAALPTSGLSISPDEFLRAVRSPSPAWLPPDLGISGSLEGYLFPGEYRFSRDARVQDLIQAFLNRFNEEVGEGLREGFTRQGLSLPEAVILASIVQREGVIPDERPMIASVFLNRLSIGMRLEADPTVQYAAGYQPDRGGWWVNPITRADLEFDSRYNTYLYPGLPPGPICNPSLSALQAVAFPAQSPYYYFRARCDHSGLHLFAVTYEEHVQNACP